jgi:hypothetical protein
MDKLTNLHGRQFLHGKEIAANPYGISDNSTAATRTNRSTTH